jgi:helicase
MKNEIGGNIESGAGNGTGNKTGNNSLNEFQSFAFQKFVQTQKNLVVIAPTGVGKTFFAQYVSALLQSKVLYAVPLKSLAYEITERFHSFSNTFPDTSSSSSSSQGVSAVALLSESYEDEPEEIREKVVVSSYEKADGLTRRNYRWLDEVRLLVVDEIHNLSYKERARAIENLVAWAKNGGVRVLAMSGTLPWADELASWLDADLVRWEKRPIPLHKFVQVGNTLMSPDGSIIQVKGDLVKKFVKHNKTIMVFANTKKKAESLHLMYSRVFGDRVTYIHSGLDSNVRKRIIQDTLRGKYNIIVSTTALGQGVNLPFYAVIFDDLHLPIIVDGHFAGWKFMDPLEFDQVCGRAGRPGFDEEGLCVIQAQDMRQASFFMRKYLNPEPPKLSTDYPLKDLVLVTMSRLVYAPLEKIVQNVHYSYTHRNTPEKDIRAILEGLVDHDFVSRDETGYSITGKGIAVSYSYIDVDTAFYYINALDAGRDFRDAVLYSSKVQEATKGRELSGVLDAWIHGVDEYQIVRSVDSFSRADLERFVTTVSWQAFAMYRLAKVLGKKEAGKILSFYLSVKFGVPRDVVPLMSLPGIGRKRAILLHDSGIKSKEDLCVKREVSAKILGDKAVKYMCR